MGTKKRKDLSDYPTIYAINALPREKRLEHLTYWYPEAWVGTPQNPTGIQGKLLAASVGANEFSVTWISLSPKGV